MSLILGMDTGGTYTDGVLINSKTKEILFKAKALTTKEDLTIGIENCIRNMKCNDFSQVQLVSLSTTLATNSLVEGRGGKVGLILMGDELQEEIPVELWGRVKGKFDIMGGLQEELDVEQAKELLESFRGKVQAVAISGYASVRNPKHEQILKNLAEGSLHIPVVCAHQLTSALGFYQRTVTAVLNARLIPVIYSLITSTKTVLEKNSIKAPIMMVKGDGTLMPETLAMDKPIETILSGPAASVIGGAFLTKKKDALILDMGGTTTDIAHIQDGAVKIKKEGAKVGGWFTRVQAAEISTFGLGGDSHIFLNSAGKIEIGPEKVIPLSLAGRDFPNLLYEMRSFKRHGEYKSYSPQETDCYILLKIPDSPLQNIEQSVLDILRDGPHSLSHIAGLLNRAPETMDMTPYIKQGILNRISMTPTDVLHVQGKYTEWNQDIAGVGAEILSKRMEIPIEQFLRRVEKLMAKKICMVTLQSIADFESHNIQLDQSNEVIYLLNKVLENQGNELLKVGLSLEKPIIAIGAPASAWTSGLKERLDGNVIIPEHAEVANAIGAAVGQIMEVVDLLISLDPGGKSYILNMPWDRKLYATLDEAMFYAVHEGRKHIESILFGAGCNRCEILEEFHDIMVELKENEAQVLMGKKVKITGIGKPIL